MTGFITGCFEDAFYSYIATVAFDKKSAAQILAVLMEQTEAQGRNNLCHRLFRDVVPIR